MKWIKGFLKFVAFLYLLGCVAVYFYQERLIFLPSQLPDNHKFRAGEEVYIPVEDDIDLHALWLKEPRRSRGVILFWHGNRGSNHWCLRQADQLVGLGYDVFMPDYRGYGKSDGEPESDQQMYDDAQEVYDWLKQHYSEDKIVLVGYSLGTAVASHLAQANAPQQLVLVAPYQSMIAMKNLFLPIAPTLLLKYGLRNDRHLSSYTGMTTIFHGMRDELIPFSQSETLAALKPSGIDLVALRNAGHRGVMFSGQLRKGVRELLR